MIHLEKISLNIHGQTLLTRTNLAIAPSDKVVICGASGTGKSSLLKFIIGMLPWSEGSIRVNGLELSQHTVATIRNQIAFIGQEPTLGAERVKEALLLPFAFKAHQQVQPTDELIFQTLERLHLDPAILDKPSKRISGGEKQRIAIARALLLNKSIFFADEVTSALDQESKAAVIAALFRSKITLLSVSHDPDWIKACSRIVEIKNHKLVEATP
ncbi:MAG: ABC transporter ATP-binding protein [Pontiella sp.]